MRRGLCLDIRIDIIKAIQETALNQCFSIDLLATKIKTREETAQFYIARVPYLPPPQVHFSLVRAVAMIKKCQHTDRSDIDQDSHKHTKDNPDS